MNIMVPPEVNIDMRSGALQVKVWNGSKEGAMY